MSEIEPGWLPDPYGRYQQRYWDGTEFTGRVRTGDGELDDPMGASTSIPFATPETARASPSGLQQFTTPLGADARERPAPKLSLALAGLGGLVVSIGVAAWFLGDQPTRGKGILAAIVLIVGALAIRLAVKEQDEARSAAVASGAVGIFVLVAALLANADSTTGPALLLGLLFTAAWALPGFRGRPLMLGLGALFFVSALVSAVADGGLGDESGAEFGLLPVASLGSNTTTQGVVALLCAAALIGAVWTLDRQRYAGVATSLVPAGLLSATTGVVLLSSQIGDSGGPLLATVVGALICSVGSAGKRRATSWWGAAITAIGAIAFVASVFEPTSVMSVGTMLVITGLLLAGVPRLGRAIGQSSKPQ